jgi:hypothetical protein
LVIIVERQKSELEKLPRKLKQVNNYQEELKSEILIAKRTTLKSKKELLKKEREKKRQVRRVFGRESLL